MSEYLLRLETLIKSDKVKHISDVPNDILDYAKMLAISSIVSRARIARQGKLSPDAFLTPQQQKISDEFMSESQLMTVCTLGITR